MDEARIRDTGNASGPDTQATAFIDESASADSETGAAQQASLDAATAARRRSGRSMTVRQRRAPPSIDGTIGIGGGSSGAATAAAAGGSWTASGGSGASSVTGPPSRPVVLVPHRRSRATRDRIVTFRVAVFIIVLAGLLAGTAGVVIWFEQSTYYVGLNGNAVAIYQGRPGGILWFKPQLIETSQVDRSQLLSSTIATLRVGITESSLPAAERVIARLRNEKQIALAAGTTTTTSTTTTTTSPTTTTSTTFATTVPSTVPTTTQPKRSTTTTTRPITTKTTLPATTSTTRPSTTTTTSATAAPNP
jgi:hypothetical protein